MNGHLAQTMQGPVTASFRAANRGTDLGPFLIRRASTAAIHSPREVAPWPTSPLKYIERFGLPTLPNNPLVSISIAISISIPVLHYDYHS